MKSKLVYEKENELMKEKFEWGQRQSRRSFHFVIKYSDILQKEEGYLPLWSEGWYSYGFL